MLQTAKKEMYNLKEDLKDMESLRLELADFFCEDEKTFKLEECFKTLQTFCDRFNKAKLVSLFFLLLIVTMLNFLNGIIHLPFLKLSIIIFRDIKMRLQSVVSQQYRAWSDGTEVQASLAVY